MYYGESTTKEIKRIYPQKRGSQMRLNFPVEDSSGRICLVDGKKGGGKVDEEDDEDDEIRKKTI
jgi:hypothetical protein